MHPSVRRIFALAGIALPAILTTSSAIAATSWVSTATQAIPVSKLLSATDFGALPVSTPLTVRVALTIQNKSSLLQYLAATSTPGNALYGQYLTPTQFTSMFGATSAQVQAVTNYLQSLGFSNIVVEPNHLIVSADGTAQQAEYAFNVQLERFQQFGKLVYGNKTAAQVPSSLSGIVSAVLGLNTIGHMSSTIALPTAAPQYLVSYTPKQFQTIYSAKPNTNAFNVDIAIMAEGDMTGVIKDLRIAEKAFGQPQANVTVMQVGLPSPDTSGADEWDMDTQYSTGISGGIARLYLYTTTSLSDSDLALEFSRWVTDDRARAASASLGECEAFPYIDGSMLVDDMIFLEAAAQGQTFFASSGDTGSFCPVAPTNGVPAGAPLVSYPAASPYVIGVGGTTLLTNADGSYDKEISWYAGGGGVSQFEGATYWQKAANTLISQSGFRGVPDIAYDADPNSGALVYVNGVAEGVGGTSLSSPLALGTWARALSVNSKLGFAGPRLYSLYNGAVTPPTYPTGGFHDIIVGANGIYTALPGYDFTTGLGTPIINQLVLDLSK